MNYHRAWLFTIALVFMPRDCRSQPQPGQQGVEVRFRDPKTNKITSLGIARRLTLEAGHGVMLAATGSQAPDQDVTIVVSVDSAVMASVKRLQSGQPFRCFPSSGNGTAYSCNMLPVLENYEPGQPLILFPDVNCRANPTLNIANLGARAIKKKHSKGLVGLQHDDLIAGVPYLLISTDNEWVLMH